MKSDEISIGELYDEILEEGWKSKLAGAGAAALGVASMWPVADKPDDFNRDTGEVIVTTQSVNDLMQDDTRLVNLVKSYFKSIGKDVEVHSVGDNIVVKSQNATKSVSKHALGVSVEIAVDGDYTQNLYGYIASQL